MSTFDFDVFFTYNGDEIIVFHANKYTMENAIKKARVELGVSEDVELSINKAWVYYGFGTDSEETRKNGYWLVKEKGKRSFPVIAISKKECEWP